MTSHLDRWEKDPFFPAAEEVQESADRMESTYRTLIHASKDPSIWNTEALRRDLQTTLGTTKWQLEEFEQAVASSYGRISTDGAKDRHRDFISAIQSQISRVESSWNDSSVSTGKPPRPWVRLDEGERKELALFLSGSATSSDHKPAKPPLNDDHMGRRKQRAEAKRGKFSGHRRTASEGADVSSWKINIADDFFPHGKTQQTPRKILSFSGLLNTLESASRFKWPKNGYRKLKLMGEREEDDVESLETHPLTRSIKGSHERSKSCPERCDDHHDKRFYGWFGFIRRLFRRSQYYMMYSRRTQMIFVVLVIVCLIGLVAIRTT